MSVAMNSTSIPSSPASSWAFHTWGLPYLLVMFAKYRPELETLFLLAIYSPFLARTVIYVSPKTTRAKGYPYLPMIIHITSGPLLVLRYHARYAALREWPKPDSTDLALFSLFNLTSFLLEVHRSRSSYTTPVIRAGFQVAVLMHCSVFLAAWTRGRDPGLFRASVKFINWFAWFRVVGRALPWLYPRLGEVKHYAEKFEVSLISSAGLALWEAGFPAGVPILLSLVSVFILSERALAELLSGYPDDNPFKQFVLASGYVDFNHLKAKAGQPADSRVPVVQGDGEKVELYM